MKTARLNRIFFAATFASLSMFAAHPGRCDEALTKGMSLYQQKKYQPAIDSFKASKSQGDPLLHYYMANSFASLGNHKEAINEYQRCSQLDPDPETADYCAEALKHYGALGNSFAAGPALAPSHVPTSTKNMNTSLKENLDGEKQAVERARADAKKIIDTAKAETAKIQAEAREEAAALPQYRHNGYWRSATTEEIKEDAQQRSKAIMEKAQAEADAKIKAASDHQAAITSVAQELRTGGKGKHVNPKNSNLYVRNYR